MLVCYPLGMATVKEIIANLALARVEYASALSLAEQSPTNQMLAAKAQLAKAKLDRLESDLAAIQGNAKKKISAPKAVAQPQPRPISTLLRAARTGVVARMFAPVSKPPVSKVTRSHVTKTLKTRITAARAAVTARVGAMLAGRPSQVPAQRAPQIAVTRH